MNSALKMMYFVFKMMILHLKMLYFVFNMMVCAGTHLAVAAARHRPGGACRGSRFRGSRFRGSRFRAGCLRGGNAADGRVRCQQVGIRIQIDE